MLHNIAWRDNVALDVHRSTIDRLKLRSLFASYSVLLYLNRVLLHRKRQIAVFHITEERIVEILL
jgi:hypothetical protein